MLQKNIDYIEKCFKQKLLIIKLTTKSAVNAYLLMTCIYPRSGARRSQKFAILKYYNAQEWECIFTLEMNTAKDIDYIEK